MSWRTIIFRNLAFGCRDVLSQTPAGLANISRPSGSSKIFIQLYGSSKMFIQLYVNMQQRHTAKIYVYIYMYVCILTVARARIQYACLPFHMYTFQLWLRRLPKNPPQGSQHPITMAQWLVGFNPPAVGTCGVTMMRHCSKSSLGANISTTYRAGGAATTWYMEVDCVRATSFGMVSMEQLETKPLADMNHEILNMPYNALVWPLHILVTGYKNPLFLEQICRVLVTARLNKQQTKIENALRDLRCETS